MPTALRAIVLIIAAVFLIVGLIDVAEQFREGVDDVQWRYPIILIGFGIGLPFIMFSYPDMFNFEASSG